MTNYSKICCPVCRSKLLIGKDLRCAKCNAIYPIVDGIPIMLPSLASTDTEQNLTIEKEFYENMFSNLKGLDDGHCIVYGYDRIYKVMEGIERGTVIEAGCGAGHHSVNLTKMGFNVTSVDLSINGLRAAKKLAEHEGQDVLFLCGDIKRLPFEDNSFDICFCSLILHHFTGLDNVIRELCRVTRKTFVAFEVNALDPISFVRFNILNPLFGLRSISKNQRALFPKNIERILKENGFRTTTLQFEDVHEYIGKAPNSAKAKLIHIYQKAMKILPPQYSGNKFLLSATR